MSTVPDAPARLTFPPAGRYHAAVIPALRREALAPAHGPRDEKRPDQSALAAELRELSAEARVRSSVDSFARAALLGFVWAVLAGVCGKLAWDSESLPLFFWPLVLLEALLLWEAVLRYRLGRAELRREVAVLARVRALRVALGIDPPEAEPRS